METILVAQDHLIAGRAAKAAIAGLIYLESKVLKFGKSPAMQRPLRGFFSRESQ
jgi:hypothetical protein